MVIWETTHNNTVIKNAIVIVTVTQIQYEVVLSVILL